METIQPQVAASPADAPAPCATSSLTAVEAGGQASRPFTTTILGVTYEGRPMWGSLALQLWLTERQRGTKEAQALLDAHNQIARAFDAPPVDISDQFTLLPMEGLTIIPAGRGADRLIDRVVRKTARIA